MSARVVLIGAAATGIGDELARAIRATHVIAPAGGTEMERALALTTDGFVLEGYPLNEAQATRLDAFLGARAASVEIALWFRADSPVGDGDQQLLRHYRGRVVEVDAVGVTDEDDLLERALASIREATLTLVG